MAWCARYIHYGQRIGGPVTWSTVHLINRRSLQHCSQCCQQQRATWQQSRRSIFNFFRGKKTEPELEQPPPTYPVIYKLGKVSPMRTVPGRIAKPEWAAKGWVAKKPLYPQVLDAEEQEEMREAGKVARQILDFAASHLKVGVTTDYIDEVVHNACIENKVYPSTLNYYGYPKSLCTSVNNVMVHGIPDDRPLQDGDIINVDITIYKNGFHADLSETYLIGDVDDVGKNLVRVARKCRDEAIKKCGPNIPISVIGDTVHQICKEEGVALAPGFDGHGIGRYFHCKPHIWHYYNNYPEEMESGMAFTIEPVILEREDNPRVADDNWTTFSLNHTRSAQFEHTILITNAGYEVLTADAENETFGAKTQYTSEADDIISGQSPASSDWTFK